MKFYDAQFKCKCMPFLYQRLSITHTINGVWKSMSHMSLETLTVPRGLHREYYQVIDNDKDCFDGDNLKLVKYRRRHAYNNRWY